MEKKSIDELINDISSIGKKIEKFFDTYENLTESENCSNKSDLFSFFDFVKQYKQNSEFNQNKKEQFYWFLKRIDDFIALGLENKFAVVCDKKIECILPTNIQAQQYLKFYKCKGNCSVVEITK